jgi:hypothetical protein
MTIYFQKQFRPVFALFFAVLALVLLQQKLAIQLPINGLFVMVVNAMLFSMALFNFKRISQVDVNNPNAMVRSVMTGTMLKFIVFGGAALWYATQKKVPIGTNNLFIAMGLYLVYTWIEIGWTKRKKDA